MKKKLLQTAGICTFFAIMGPLFPKALCILNIVAASICLLAVLYLKIKERK